jgi:glycosyltransferase involved in cell wall biosynthesis
VSRLLFIVPYPIFPPDEGGRVRAYNILKQLAARGYDVTLFTPRSPANAECDLPIALFGTTAPGRRNQIVSPGFFRRTLSIARQQRPDAIIVEYPWSGIHGWWLSRRLGVPLVLDAPNVEGDRFRSTGSRAWRFVDVYERWVTRVASKIIVVSEEDRARFARRGVPARKLAVLPNGVDPDITRPDAEAGARVRGELKIPDGDRMALFFGQLDYAPNREALRSLRDEVFTRAPRTTFIVAGKGNVDELRRAYPEFQFTGRVDSIVPYINAADVVVAPITSGGGTRLKILESVACATPVVSTSVGAEGIDRSVCGALLTVTDDWREFAAEVESASLVKPGNVPAGFLDMYSWAGIVGRFDWDSLASKMR